MQEGDLRQRIAGLPCWTGPVEVDLLKGGLSNQSFIVSDSAGRHVVRFGEDYPFHHVSRERELMAARVAHTAGFAPRVEYAQPGIMVCAWLDAKTYDATDVVANREKIARFVRDFHGRMATNVSGPAYMFWPFHVIRDYARTLKEGNSRLASEIPFYLALADELEAAQLPMPIVFGHHDLLPANFLDDGKRLWLIDFEYAGFGTAMFDLAGLASNAGMTQEQSIELLAAYLGTAPDGGLVRAHAAMQCASLLREAMWGAVSELHLKASPDIDYAAYADMNLDRLSEALDSYRTLHGKAAS